MGTTHFGKVTVSVPYKNILYAGHTSGVTRIDEGMSLATNMVSQGSSQSALKIFIGNEDPVIGLGADHCLAVTTGDGLTYIAFDDTLLSTNPLEGTVQSSSVVDSAGAVINSDGEIILLSQDIGVFVRGITVINDDDVVDFGVDGTLETYSLPDSQVGVISTPTELFIYNDSADIATAKVVIGYTGREEDSFLQLSTSSSGTFYGIRENAIKFPEDFPWENGTFQNTQVVSDYVTVSGNTGPFVYVSPVIDTFDFSTILNYRIFWVSDDPYPSTVDYPGVVDGAYTIRMRQGLIAPSGTWVSGESPEEADSLWGTDGSLEYVRVPNYSIDTFNNRYVQFEVTFQPYFNSGFILGTDGLGGVHYVTESGNPGASPKLYELGLEIPTIIENIGAHDSKAVYVRSNIPTPASGTRIKNTMRKSYLDTWWELPDG
jgi:hypothetical protein